MAPALHPATPKQESYILSLLATRLVDTAYAATISERIVEGTLDKRTAGTFIDHLRACPWKPRQAAAPAAPKSAAVDAPGMFQTGDGTIYRVKKSRESGRLYAMVLRGKKFEYDRGAIFRLTPADAMTLSAAKAYGVATGQCCVCGAELTDPKSVEAGIGPICAKMF